MADQVAEGLLSPFLMRQRISAVLPHLRGRVLDVGCGNGALAAHVKPENYVGIDISPIAIQAAETSHPAHVFRQTPKLEGELFDTVASLAVIEHVSAPEIFLAALKKNLRRLPEARIVCTTPHPSLDWVHHFGARLGLFSHSADEEHEKLLDKNLLEKTGLSAGLRLFDYKRFLLGANQIVTFGHDDL